MSTGRINSAAVKPNPTKECTFLWRSLSLQTNMLKPMHRVSVWDSDSVSVWDTNKYVMSPIKQKKHYVQVCRNSRSTECVNNDLVLTLNDLSATVSRINEYLIIQNWLRPGSSKMSESRTTRHYYIQYHPECLSTDSPRMTECTLGQND